MSRLIIFVCSYCLIIQSVHGCSLLPSEVTYGRDKLIGASKIIVLASVDKVTLNKDWVIVFFSVENSLRGNLTEVFALRFHSSSFSEDEHLDLDNHSNDEFWSNEYPVGRNLWLPGRCEPVYSFKKGVKYLLFVDALKNPSASERINSVEDDLWYRYVKSNL